MSFNHSLLLFIYYYSSKKERRWLYIRNNKCPVREFFFISLWHIFRQLNDWCVCVCVHMWKSAIDFLFPMHSAYKQKSSKPPSIVSQINSRHSSNFRRTHFDRIWLWIERKLVRKSDGSISSTIISGPHNANKAIDENEFLMKLCAWFTWARVYEVKMWCPNTSNDKWIKGMNCHSYSYSHLNGCNRFWIYCYCYKIQENILCTYKSPAHSIIHLLNATREHVVC